MTAAAAEEEKVKNPQLHVRQKSGFGSKQASQQAHAQAVHMCFVWACVALALPPIYF
jgi:hypothetical protein